jgi:hypothetical protein
MGYHEHHRRAASLGAPREDLMQKLRMAIMAGATLVAASAGAGAQLRSTATIPAGYQPPAGMCRVWFNGVAPSRQPAPTDCATARARVTSNSFLVYGQGSSQQGNGGPWGARSGGNNDQGGWNDGRDDRRNDGRYDRMSDKQRREWEKARRKAEKDREKEWNKAHKRNGRDDDRDDRYDRDRRGRRNDADNRQSGQYPQTGQGGVWNNRPGTTTTACRDLNHDGICDGQPGRRVP